MVEKRPPFPPAGDDSPRQGFCATPLVTQGRLGPDVVTAGELRRATGASRRAIERAIADLDVQLLNSRFVTWQDAVRIGRHLRSGPAAATLFGPVVEDRRSPAMPAAVSGAVHGAAAVIVALVTSAGLGTTLSARPTPTIREPMRLVFLAQPGPGGGGGGGGARQLAPPPPARMRGPNRQSSPVPKVAVPKPVAPVREPKPPDPPDQPEELPMVAPIATSPADEIARAGVLEESPVAENSRGPGVGGGVGEGTGTGIGEGDGPGVGPGSGGGTGGGPYRPGSGIEPPRLLREVRADYTEEARRAGIQGEVLLEIVVRRDGSVGETRVLQGLGHGLERRAVESVRQWRFSPARRLGAPVDVLVEVAVEFRLR